MRPLPKRPASRGLAMNHVLKALFHVDEESVYLSPAPMYHSAPIGFCSSVQSLGGTVVMMDRFDPVEALQAMETHAVTHTQWVPTMFTRMLKLPEEERAGFEIDHQTGSHVVLWRANDGCRVVVPWRSRDLGPALSTVAGEAEGLSTGVVPGPHAACPEPVEGK